MSNPTMPQLSQFPRVGKKVYRKKATDYVNAKVLKMVNHFEWAAPAFMIPKKDRSVM